MDITLTGVIPIPLKDKLSSRASNIWNTTVSFSKHQWVKIVAPSGTGKTTLMNILYKLRHDYEGVVTIGGKDIKEITTDTLATLRQQKVSVIFQDLRLFTNLSARENIELNRVLQAPHYPSSAVIEMASTLGITHILDQKAGLCSYGEQQRIAIIRALMQPFEWLIMDEPFSHLDNANRSIAAELISNECRKRNAGFILTDLDEDTHFEYTHTYSL